MEIRFGLLAAAQQPGGPDVTTTHTHLESLGHCRALAVQLILVSKKSVLWAQMCVDR